MLQVEEIVFNSRNLSERNSYGKASYISKPKYKKHEETQKNINYNTKSSYLNNKINMNVS